MSHFVNGPSPHRVGAFGTAGFPINSLAHKEHEEVTSEGTRNRAIPPDATGKSCLESPSATRNSEYLGSGRCSEVSITREVLCFFFQALLFESHPTFGKTHLYTEVFYPHSWDPKPSNLLLSLLFFSRNPPG